MNTGYEGERIVVLGPGYVSVAVVRALINAGANVVCPNQEITRKDVGRRFERIGELQNLKMDTVSPFYGGSRADRRARRFARRTNTEGWEDK